MNIPVAERRAPRIDGQPATTTRIPVLDGLRGVAILMVLLWHGMFIVRLDPGLVTRALSVGRLFWSGVDLFFVLSGFLIGGILLDSRDSPRYYSTFYLRRFYRILPVYTAVLAILKYIPAIFLHSSVGRAIPALSYATFTQNFWMAALGTFGAVSLGATWSLAVEEQFYFTAPLIVRKLNRMRLAVLLVSVVVLAPLLRMLLIWGFRINHLATYVLMPCRADALSLGMLAALLVRDTHAREVVSQNRTVLFWATFAMLIVLAWMTYRGYREYSTQMVTIGYSVLALFYTGCLLIALLKTALLQRVLCTKWLTQLGGISYCVYLVHMPLILAGRSLLRTTLARLGLHIQYEHVITMFAGSLLGIGFALAVGKLSWRFLEQPMLRRGHTYKY